MSAEVIMSADGELHVIVGAPHVGYRVHRLAPAPGFAPVYERKWQAVKAVRESNGDA